MNSQECLLVCVTPLPLFKELWIAFILRAKYFKEQLFYKPKNCQYYIKNRQEGCQYSQNWRNFLNRLKIVIIIRGSYSQILETQRLPQVLWRSVKKLRKEIPKQSEFYVFPIHLIWLVREIRLIASQWNKSWN